MVLFRIISGMFQLRLLIIKVFIIISISQNVVAIVGIEALVAVVAGIVLAAIITHATMDVLLIILADGIMELIHSF